MKHLIHRKIRGFLVLFYIPCICIAQPMVKTQLESLNQNWKVRICSVPAVMESKISLPEKELIRLHLILVETELRKNIPVGFNREQVKNRMHCLDILHSYGLNGAFPQNSHFSNRVPVFIDENGTYCAVGQLVKETGSEVLTKQISRENNYAYIMDMHYAELDTWAERNGFLKEELAWIQPCYCSTPSPGIIWNVSCYGGADGAWIPAVPSSVPAPYTYSWSQNGSPTFCGGCGLTAGTCTCIVTDGNGNPHLYTATVTQPTALADSLTNTAASCGTCADGTASATASGGTPPYTYSWNPAPGSGQGTPHASWLSPGTYTCCITDNNSCQTCKTVTIGFTTSILKLNLPLSPGFVVQPNPFYETVIVEADYIDSSAELIVYDVIGKETLRQKISPGRIYLNTSGFSRGFYFFVVMSNHVYSVQKLVRN
ncbi:MAG: T9SS type A sorting domain-containing protein [Sphingobacteriales bacterium]